MKLSLALLVLGLGCAGNARSGGPPQPGVITEQLVAGWNGCVDRFHNCPGWEPYFRPGDDQWGPIYWLISSNGWACEVTSLVSDAVHRGEYWPCIWRHPHKRF